MRSFSTLLADTRRNRIVNSAMQHDQENGGGVVSLAGGVYYPSDQWGTYGSHDGGGTWQNVADAAFASGRCLKATVTIADASIAASQQCVLLQSVEGAMVADFKFGTAAAKSVILQFKTSQPVAGTYPVALRNKLQNRSYIKTYSIAAGEVNKVVEKTLAFPGDTSGTWESGSLLGLDVIFPLACGTGFQGAAGAWLAANKYATSALPNALATVGNVVTFGDVGLYVDIDGTGIAPRFEVPNYADELRRCERYYLRREIAVGATMADPGNPAQWTWTPMRASPTLALVSSNGGALAASGASGARASANATGFGAATLIASARM